MSTVVGTCTDCIVTLPIQPQTTLLYSVNVVQGNNLVLKDEGTFNSIFAANNISIARVEIAPQASYLIGAINSIFIDTTQPVQVTFASGTNLLTLTVTKQLLLDQAYDSVTITNTAATGGKTAYVFTGSTKT